MTQQINDIIARKQTLIKADAEDKIRMQKTRASKQVRTLSLQPFSILHFGVVQQKARHSSQHDRWS